MGEACGGLQPVLHAGRAWPGPAAQARWPLWGSAASRALEAQALATSAPGALMARAGLSMARLAAAWAPHARRIVVAAGGGHNGGDALIAAAHLQAWGRQVEVHWLRREGASLPPQLAQAAAQAQQAGVRLHASLDEPAGPAGLALDGLLGLGVQAAPHGVIAEGIAALQRWRGRGTPLLAVDLPSGLDADHGIAPGAAVQADGCLSLLTLKPGLFTAQGRDHAAAVWFDDLGVPGPEAPDAWLQTDGQRLAPRRHAQHKGSFGDLMVIGGAAGMEGAAVLAAHAALAAGAGRVWWVGLGAAVAFQPGVPPQLMRRTPAQALTPQALAGATVVCGCGGGAEVAAVLPALLPHAARLVLDADALNALAADAGLRQALAARAGCGLPTVLTPHPLEAARLAGLGRDQVQADRRGVAVRLAQHLGATTVLKGSGTVIATDGLPPVINASGNARLAVPGSGDVLAGWLGGLWSARGAQAAQAGAATPASAAALAYDTSCLAVWQHGQAAERAPGHGPLAAAELVAALSSQSAG